MAEINDWHWRNSMRAARFFAFDGRAVLGILLVLVHVRLWTAMLAMMVIAIFWIAERAGFTFDAVLRKARTYVSGNYRPSVVNIRRRRLKDFGK